MIRLIFRYVFAGIGFAIAIGMAALLIGSFVVAVMRSIGWG